MRTKRTVRKINHLRVILHIRGNLPVSVNPEQYSDTRLFEIFS